MKCFERVSLFTKPRHHFHEVGRVGRYRRYPLIGYDVRSSSTALTSAALVTPLASNTPSAPS